MLSRMALLVVHEKCGQVWRYSKVPQNEVFGLSTQHIKKSSHIYVTFVQYSAQAI